MEDQKVVNKMLYFAAGLLITVALIAIGFSLMNRARSISGNMDNRTLKEQQAMEEAHITKYDGSKITGSEAVNYIKSIFADVPAIVVKTDEGGTKTSFTVQDTMFPKFKNSAESCYIDPLDLYMVSVTRDANGIIAGVEIRDTNY
ncbi:MAG: hypothetical protein MJ124_09150 [Lachnospiraceae bacterium]|nr:hypothetical protein [Lachnospiraceae bacterium]